MTKTEAIFGVVIVICGVFIAVFIALSLRHAPAPIDDIVAKPNNKIHTLPKDKPKVNNDTTNTPHDRYAGEITGIIRDSSGQYVTDALIQSFFFENSQDKEGNSARSKDGHFTIKGLRPAVYSIRAWKEGYGSKQVDQIDLIKNPSITLNEPITLQKSQGIEIVVTTGSGLPIQDAKLVVKTRALLGSSQFYGVTVAEKLTDANGKVVLNDLSDGGYELIASKPSYTIVNENLVIQQGKIASRWRGIIVLNPVRKQ